MGEKSLTILRKMKVKDSNWRGSQIDIILGLYYLKNKYKNLILFGEPEINYNYDFDQVVQNTSLYFNFDKDILTVPIGFVTKLVKNLKNPTKRFGILPVFMVGKQFESAHSNMIIFDFFERTFERFEPYGFSTDDTKLDRELKKTFVKKFKLSYLKPLVKGDFQEIEEHQISMNVKTAKDISSDPGGYCAAWCIWYSEMRVKNPDIGREKLSKIVRTKIKNMDNSVRTFIRNYAGFLIRIRKRTLRKKNLGSKRTRFSRIEQVKTLLNDRKK